MDAVAVAKLKKFREDFETPILPAKAGWLRKNVHGEGEGEGEQKLGQTKIALLVVRTFSELSAISRTGLSYLR